MHTILLVEDEPSIREVLQDLLESEGFSVLTACHGAEALNVLRYRRPISLILLDWDMPIMTGGEFLLEKAKSPVNAEIPVVIISAGEVSQADIGTLEFFPKPFDLKSLFAVVRKYCA